MSTAFNVDLFGDAGEPLGEPSAGSTLASRLGGTEPQLGGCASRAGGATARAGGATSLPAVDAPHSVDAASHSRSLPAVDVPHSDGAASRSNAASSRPGASRSPSPLLPTSPSLSTAPAPTPAPLDTGAVSGAHSLIAAIEELAAGMIDGLAGQELLEFSSLLARAETKLGALRSSTLARIEATGDWKEGGARTVADYERQISKRSTADSRKAVRRAKALAEDLPSFRAEFSEGEVSSEHIDVLARATQSPVLKEQLADPDDGEMQLLKDAKVMDAGTFEKRVKAWSIKHAPERAERMARKNLKEERLSIVQSGEGWALSGYLDSLNGAIVDSALTAEMGVPTLGDSRGPLERRAAALTEICQRISQDKDAASAGNGGAHITVQVPLETLLTTEAAAQFEASRDEEVLPDEGTLVALGPVLAEIRAGIDSSLCAGVEPATLDDGTPLVPSELMTLLCNSRISRQIFTADGLVLDHGYSTRLCTPGQKRAVIARDKTCRFPGCRHTHQASEVHHAIAWQNGGKTDIGNLVLLCWYHHRFVHAQNITIYRHRDGWSFFDAAGNQYTAHGRRRAAPPDPPPDPTPSS